MSPYTNFHAPRTSLSGRIQIGQKSGFYYYLLFYYLFSVNIKPPRHRFGLSLAWDWQYYVIWKQISNREVFFTHPFILKTVCLETWSIKGVKQFRNETFCFGDWKATEVWIFSEHEGRRPIIKSSGNIFCDILWLIYTLDVRVSAQGHWQCVLEHLWVQAPKWKVS